MLGAVVVPRVFLALAERFSIPAFLWRIVFVLLRVSVPCGDISVLSGVVKRLGFVFLGLGVKLGVCLMRRGLPVASLWALLGFGVCGEVWV